MLVYGKYEYLVMQLVYVCILSVSCSRHKCCILHNVPFVIAGQVCKGRPYGRGILQCRFQDCLVGSHECILLFTTSSCGECFYYL